MAQSSKKVGIGEVIGGEIVQGRTDDEILRKIRHFFPQACTTKKCVQYYRSKLRKKYGAQILTSAQADTVARFRLQPAA